MAYSLQELVTAAGSKFRTLYEAATQRHFPLHALSSDGDNVAAVKAASTAPVAADPALVVGFSPNGNTVGHNTTGIGHGVKTVTTAGTDVTLAASTAAKWVTVQAQTDNTGLIAVGGAGVDATEATGTGVLLEAGESYTCPCDNLADIFIDATVSGEGVRFTYGT
jgi:hypothetical protein